MPNYFARQLRRHAMDVERLLWRTLRDHRFHDYKFRRQHPIGPFIVDFVCLAKRLVIEADGGQHADSTVDARRAAWLRDRGWRLIRFWNNDILAYPDAIAAGTLSALQAPHPPRRRGDLSREVRER